MIALVALLVVFFGELYTEASRIAELTPEATLGDEDRELGVVLADIGGDTTDIAIFQDGSISHCASIPIGGRYVTADLGIVLRVTPDVAENVKFRYGSAIPLDVDPDEVLQVTSIGEETSHGVTRRHIAEIVESRVAEIFRFVAAEIEAAGATNRLQAGLVLTGGGSSLTGVARAGDERAGRRADRPRRSDRPDRDAALFRLERAPSLGGP